MAEEMMMFVELSSNLDSCATTTKFIQQLITSCFSTKHAALR
jgi:hypothetical protein